MHNRVSRGPKLRPSAILRFEPEDVHPGNDISYGIFDELNAFNNIDPALNKSHQMVDFSETVIGSKLNDSQHAILYAAYRAVHTFKTCDTEIPHSPHRWLSASEELEHWCKGVKDIAHCEYPMLHTRHNFVKWGHRYECPGLV